jgi:hypothetical protein
MRLWTHLVGRHVAFDAQGKRLVGVIAEATDNGFSPVGKIPDAKVTIRGTSGATLTVSLVEANVQLKEEKP